MINHKTEAHLIVQAVFGNNSEEAPYTSADSGWQDVNMFVVIHFATHNQRNIGLPIILKVKSRQKDVQGMMVVLRDSAWLLFL